MNNKKGFTLIELLAVIVILAVIALIVVPVVSNIITMAKTSANKRSAEGYVKAAENFYSASLLDDSKKALLDGKTNVIDMLSINGQKATKGIITIDEKGHVAMSIALNDKCYIKSASQSLNEIEVIDDVSTCTISEPNVPDLKDGMIPVIISNDGTLTKADTNTKWYDYSNKNWANMVLVTKNTRISYINAVPGTNINLSDVLGYFVWIPRYKYQLFNADGVINTSPQEINIEFQSQGSKAEGSKNGEWLTMPAFTFDDNELSGIWVGKFETTGDETTPTVLPNSVGSHNANVSAMFTTSRQFSSDVYGVNSDAHMARNSDWAAIAYLSQSKYGRCTDGTCTKIRLNNNAGGLTGCGALNDNAEKSTSCDIEYSKNDTYPQTTTGNITGIFDMAGGNMEYLMGSYSLDSSGFSKYPESKYYDYYGSDEATACGGKRCLGHALSETRGWDTKFNYYVGSGGGWYKRGGASSNGESASIWIFSSGAGQASNNSYRTVIVP